MRYLFIFFILFTLSVKAQSVITADILNNDTTFLIENKNYSGCFFTANSKESILREAIRRFTPTVADIDEAEIALAEVYHHPEMMDGKKLYGRKVLVDVTPRFSNYKRQYVGYVSTNGDKVLIVTILNFKNQQLANQYFKRWMHHFILGFDGYYEHGYTEFEYNLSTKKIQYQ